MKPKNTICLLALACAFATGARAQNISSPTSKDDTDERIAARAQLTDVPTIYIWMLDAEVEYDKNNQPVKPKEYKNTTGDKNDNYYLVKLQGGSTYETKISNNIIAKDPDCTNNVALRPNYGYSFDHPYYDNNFPKSDEYRLARIKVVDAAGSIKSRDELTTIRGRGNSTWASPKKAYRLKFPNKTKFLAKEDGTNEYADAKNWTLLANVADKSMLRNALTREVCLRIEEKTGVKALPFYPAYKFVDLVLNNEYIGTYQISDHTQIQTGRIEIDEDNGWFLEGVATNSAFIEDPHISVNSYDINVKNPEDEFYTDAKEMEIASYLTTITTFAKHDTWSPSDFSEATGVFKYVDMESAVSYFIGNEISGNFDGLISNYAYRDINPGDKLKFGPLWDFDIAYGNHSEGADLVHGFIFNAGKWPNTVPMAAYSRNLTQYSPEFVTRLIECWDKVYDNGSLTTYMLEKVDEIAAGIANSRTLNYTSKDNGGAGWSITEKYLSWVSNSPSSYEDDINTIKSFIQNHNEWLNTAIHQLKSDMTVSDVYTLDAEKQYDSWDDPKYYIPDTYRGKICDVKLQNRTFKAGKWNTICLPFALSQEQLAATFSADVELLEYTGVIADVMQFTPVADTRLVAGVPYLLKFSGSDVTDPSFQQVGVSCLIPATISFDDAPGYHFTGTYFKTNISTDGTTLLLDAGQESFERNTSESTLTGCSAYVTCPSGVTTMPISSNWIVLDNDADNTQIIADNLGKTVSVELQGRTLYTDGSWNSLCLPFRISSDYTGTIFEGAEFMQLGKVELDGSTLKFNFYVAGDVYIDAGEPCFVRWKDADNSLPDIENPRFKDVVIETQAPRTMYGNATGNFTSEEGSILAFKGLYAPLSFKKAGDNTVLYLGEDNMLYYPNGKMTIGAFRAYFQLLGDLTAGEPDSSNPIRAFELNFETDETAISTITKEAHAAGTPDAWYTLDGRRLSSEPTAPGIYISRGRKIIIK